MAKLVVVALALSLALAGTAAGAGGRSGKLVTYEHDGGFTGDHDSLTVFRNGKAVSSNGPFVLSTRRRLSLERALVAARFATLRSQYVPTDPVTDGYADHVTYAGRSVGVTQGANPPARLQRVLALLADILGRRR